MSLKIKIHTQGIKGSGAVAPGEEAAAQFNGILEINGQLIEEVGETTVQFNGGEFVTVMPIMHPGSFEVVQHDRVTWDALVGRRSEKIAKAGQGVG